MSLTTLTAWAAAIYGDKAPNIQTLRRWCRDGKIYPPPQKHGRTYYLKPTARYVGDYNSPEFMGSLHDASQAQ